MFEILPISEALQTMVLSGADIKALQRQARAEGIATLRQDGMNKIHRGITTWQALQKDWNFYLAYNMFRIAAILQGIAKRVEDGTASSAQAKASGAGARPMAELAWLFARRH